MRAKHARKVLRFPTGGLDRSQAYRQQPPFTTPDCLNVRPSSTLEGRERGGSRPGLVRSHVTDLGGPVRLLHLMTLASGDGFTAWLEPFDGLSLGSVWSTASWGLGAPHILPAHAVSVDTDRPSADVVRSALPIDATEQYAVEMFIAPWGDEHHGEYRLYLRLDDATPDIETDGVVVELTLVGASGAYEGTLTTVTGGVETAHTLASGVDGSAEPGWLVAMVAGDTVTVYWRDHELISQAVDAHTGLRVGFGMTCTEDGGVCVVNAFRTQYYSTSPVDDMRDVLIASAAGDLFQEGFYGRLSDAGLSRTVRDDTLLSSAQWGQKLYIADYGEVAAEGTDGSVNGTSLDAAGVADWTALGITAVDYVAVVSNPLGTATAGTYRISAVAAGNLTLATNAGLGGCAYRIERGPKVYDPATGTMELLTATAGQVPTGCPLVCRYLDRIVLAGAAIAPHVWYMSRAGDPTDWDYSQDDSQRAVAGTSSEAGVPGEPITALAPHADDYLVIGCLRSLWRMRGDPAYGGALDNLSRTAGPVGPQAWCIGPGGEMVYLSLDGVYLLPPGGESVPRSLSREKLPVELRNINPEQTTVLLEYDVTDRGVHIFLSGADSTAQPHWWLDWENGTFWPLSLDGDHDPTAICAIAPVVPSDSSVVLGGRDGFLRRFSPASATDCGTAYLSYVVIGPVALASDGQAGRLLSLDGELAGVSGSVEWSVGAALTFEGAVAADVVSTGTWVAGLNSTVHPVGYGQAFVLRLDGAGAGAWGLETVVAMLRKSGRRRVP